MLGRSTLVLTLLWSGSLVHAGTVTDFASSCPTFVALDGAFGSLTRLAGIIEDSTSQEPLRLTPSAVEVTSGFVVSKQLAAKGFLPDEANVKLTAYLNPQIKDLNALQPGTRVYLPDIEVYRDGEWSAFKAAKPIDGFAIDAKYTAAFKDDIASDIDRNVKGIAATIAASAYTDSKQNAGDVAILSDLSSNLTERASDLQPADWSKLSDAVAVADNYATYVEKNAALASRLQEVGFATQVTSASLRDTTAELTASLGRAGTPGLIDVTMLATSRDGKEIPGLVFKYMSKVAHDQLKCDLKHGIPFATESYRASQSMRRAEWYIWAEDPATGARSKEYLRDFTTFLDDTVVAKFYVDWP